MNSSPDKTVVGSPKGPAVAIVGMAGQFPGAENVEAFWENLKAGVESVSRFTPEELEARDSAAVKGGAEYIAARSILPDADKFDPAFFNIHPKEAAYMDPQHRVFLECCWNALESAGYDPLQYAGLIGVFGGCSMNTYLLANLCSDRGFIDELTGTYPTAYFQQALGNDKDFLATRVSYKLNLRGPSVSVQTACSTSLVAICQAAQNLLQFNCDMALAGGVAITFPQKRGYPNVEGGIGSSDGHCRTFDAKASGTVFGNGAAVVLLKRLNEAEADGDTIYAILRGFAVNNDGAQRVGYTAPGVDGQAEVIATAQAIAGVTADDISYIEAHGTATPLGDPIEVAALTKAFRETTNAKNFCAIGTAKTNLGHLEHAAGAIGVIKTALSLKHKQIPGMLHFEKANPKIDFANSPFFVATSLKPWDHGRLPRRAGISAFGLGGTNAHVVLEEATQIKGSAPKRKSTLLLLSARSDTALANATSNLSRHIQENSEIDLADAAYTLQVGRRAFDHRRIAVCTDIHDAINALENRSPERLISHAKPNRNLPVVFLFAGQGTQRLNMGRELFETEPRFKQEIKRCAEALKPKLGLDLCEVLYPAVSNTEAERVLNQATTSQAAIFTVEYALAKLWMHWGIQPAAFVGYSIGELVAACLSGVITLNDAVTFMGARGELLKNIPAGAMLSVRLSENELKKRLGSQVEIASVNSASLCVVAGPSDAIDSVKKQCEADGIPCQILRSPHAYHSSMMDPVTLPLKEVCARMAFRAPKIPILSCVTRDWLTPAIALDPGYWAKHSRECVHFSEALKRLQPDQVILEVGQGSTLSTLVRQNCGPAQGVTYSLPDSEGLSETKQILTALGQLWLMGAQPNWRNFYGDERRLRIPLPTYPFERIRCWIEPPQAQSVKIERAMTIDGNDSTGNTMVETAPTVHSIPDRKHKIVDQIIAIIEEASGSLLTKNDSATHFLELGFDSLLLTQIAQDLKKKFNVAITFRQLQDKESNLDALAAYLGSKLPPEEPARSPMVTSTISASIVPPAAQRQTLNSAPLPGGTQMDGVANVFNAQLKMMSDMFAQQIDVMQRMMSGVASSPVNAATQTPVSPLSKTQISAAPEVKAESRPSVFIPFKPVQRGATGGLTPQQDAHIKNLIERYTLKTAGSKRITQSHRRTFADPRIGAGFRSQWKEMVYPIVTIRSKGSRLWDVDGNEYIDILGGFGPVLLGHSPDFVTEAVEKQIKAGVEIGPLTPLAGKVADMICELTGVERVSFCNSGSEAVAGALRLSRTVTARSKVVIFAGSYHGMFDEVLVKGTKRAGVPHTAPSAPGIPSESVENMIVLDYGTNEALEFIAQHASELAAVLVEPVQSRHPELQPKEFLQKVREITSKSGTVLIFDEVVTGFRSHIGGAQALFGIRADLVTYGKVLGGGYPIGVIAGKSEFMDALDGGYWQFGDESYPEKGVTFFAGTFFRHPMMLAAAEAVLLHLKSAGPELQTRLAAKTAQLVARLNHLFQANQVPTRIETFSSFFYFSFASDQRFGSLLYYHLREKGVHLQEGFPCFLNTAHTDADLEFVYNAFADSIAEMQRGGVFPSVTPVLLSPSPNVLEAPQVASASLTEEQIEIWLTARLRPEASCVYNESVSVRLNGQLDETAFRKAFNQVVERHDALRTVFDTSGEIQRFVTGMTIELTKEDWSDFELAVQDSRLHDEIERDARLPFDLIVGPLVRAKLIKLQPMRHVLLFTAHHIVCDGWSTNVILDELTKLYNGIKRGTQIELPAPRSFSTYARAQKEHLEGPTGAAVSFYWLEQYAAPVSILDLPTDRPRPRVRTYAGATIKKSIPPDTYQALKRSAARRRCTLFSLLLGGFQILISRLSGQSDVVVGIPMAGQSLLEDEILVGHCVNFLPLRIMVKGSPTVLEFLNQVKQILLGAKEHQNYTYGRLVRHLKLQRDASRLPLTELQFNLERVGSDESFDGVETIVEANPKSAVNFDLFFNVIESSSKLDIDCDFNTDLYDRSTILRWLDQYETVIEAIASFADDMQIDSLPVMSPVGVNEILVNWNKTAAEYPRQATVHKLFEAQAGHTPNAIALSCEDRNWTYDELNQRSNRLASHLRSLGVKTGTRVAICLDRSIEMVGALLAVLKCGAAYIPLDPDNPLERSREIISDARPAVILTSKALESEGLINGTTAVYLDGEWMWRQDEHVRNLPLDSNELAYVIYTSGSTGKPKGVAVTHRALVNFLFSMREKPGFSAQDTLLAVTTLSFDIAGLEIYLPLITGGRVIISSREERIDGHKLAERISRSGVTVMQATPATWQLLIESGWTGKPDLKILCGGDALPAELASKLVKHCGSLWNVYGPTETTVWSSTIKLESVERITIGHPIANTQFYILDPKLRPVPIGASGELYIGGDGLARGYFNRPDLTAEKFIPNPFGQAGSRIYATGDLARYLPDATVEVLGRIDFQTKIRGFRIELGEIESVILRHPSVSECVVTAQEHLPGEKRLVAYVVQKPQSTQSGSEGESATVNLRAYVMEKLPIYMVPSAFVNLKKLPLNTNGKVDRKALPAPESEQGIPRNEYAAPRTADEKKLVEILGAVLRLERVGIHDDIFELGADSLLIYRVATRAGQAGISFSPIDLFQYRTVAALAANLPQNGYESKIRPTPIKALSREAHQRVLRN